MIAWWIGVIAFLVVGLPLLILVLNGVLRAAREMQRLADSLADQGSYLTSHLEGLEDVRRMPHLADEVVVELVRYGRAIDDLR